MPWRAHHVLSVPLLLALCALAAGCDRTAASGLSPDFAGEWDVTYDDSMRFELRMGGQVQRAELEEAGGQFALRDAGMGLEIDVDCARPELVCPSEVWPRELALTQAPGQVDAEGMQLSHAIAGQGTGRCTSLAGSTIVGEVASVTKPDSVRQEAVALTNGRVFALYDAACFAPFAGLPAGTQVALSAGFTAAKR
ncbi:MAG: hypothetical protein ABW352_22135 [Polyangiales bacterium]